MFLASKYEEANHLRLETLCTSVCYDKFTKEQIKDMEMEMLECLDFNILGPNIYSFVCIILEKANFLEQFNEEKRNLVRELSLYMTKMVYYEYTVIRNHFSTILAASICLVSMKLLSKIEPELNISANVIKIFYIFI